MIDEDAIRRRFEALRDRLDERGRRLFAAAAVRAAGYGGLAAVARATGLARSTLGRGLKELDQPPLPAGRQRRPGSGRRPLTDLRPTLLDDLRRLVEPVTLGDPMRPLGHTVSASSVRPLLAQLGYSRQANRKANDGAHHADRDAQFAHINARVAAAQAAGQPVISVDTKKKELIGNFRNGGSDYRPAGRPRRVNVHDFADQELGKVVPYGVYDLAANTG